MVRIMIVLLVLGSGFLGWTAYKQHQRIQFLRAALAPNGIVPKTVASIQQNAEEYALYKDRAASDQLKDQDPASYIRGLAGHPNINIGRLELDRTEDEPARGINQLNYRIEPNDSKTTFDRRNIANFLYKLEEDSRRVKVTYIEMNPATKIDEGARPQDTWRMKATISMRERKATGPTTR
jgi:hypothetical protein